MSCTSKMATDLATGVIPAYYREVFDLCAGPDNTVSSEMLTNVMSTSGLPTQTLGLIWTEVEAKQGPLSRTKLYKTLALIAFAQQGKQPSIKLLENFGGEEFPAPNLGNLTSLSVNRNTNPGRLGLTYADLCHIDSIEVGLVPEKKGLFLKHVEYQVSSRRLGSHVKRRYTDFVSLREALLARFPYRLVPRLPPKKIALGDAHFLEERRRGLRRWLTLVGRHPTIHKDPLVEMFLRYSGADLQQRMRDYFRRVPDEFTTSDLASRAKELAPIDNQQEFVRQRDEIKSCHITILHLKQVAANLSLRSQKYAADMLELGAQLDAFGNVQRQPNTSQSSNPTSWNNIKQSFHAIARELGVLSTHASRQAEQHQTELCDQIQLLLEVLQAHTDLWERHEKGVAHDHARALSTLLALKKKQIHGVTRGTEAESVSELEACMMRQEDVMANVELRGAFSLHCLHMETQLVHAHLELLATVLGTLVRGQANSHSELAEVWRNIETKYLPGISVQANGS